MFHGVAVRADGLSLRGGHGWVYLDVSVEAGPGGLTAVAGQAGSGRTGLLLTLAGRMKPTEGTLTVGGHRTPRAIRRVAALGLVDGVNDLEGALSVGEHLRERARGPLWSRRQAARAGTALALAGLDRSPGDRTLIRDLDREERVRLGIALALLDEPGLLVLDNVDAGLGAERRDALWATLSDLAERGLTVVASCTEGGPCSEHGPCAESGARTGNGPHGDDGSPTGRGPHAEGGPRGGRGPATLRLPPGERAAHDQERKRRAVPAEEGNR